MKRREFLGASAALVAAGTVGRNAFAAPTPTILPPDPNTKTPAFKAPPKACDTHTHIFGPDSQYPYAPDRSYTPADAGLADFKALHAKIGIERAVIVNATVHGRDNRVVTDAIAQSGGRYRGIANVDDSFTEDQIAALDKAGIRGCRFTFLKRFGGAPDMAAFQRVVAKIKPFGWHVDLYFEVDILEDLRPTLTKLPLPYAIDHMGVVQAKNGIEHPLFRNLVSLLREDEKCIMKITGPERVSATGAPFHDAVPFAQALIAAAPDRVIWGTDWPHPNVKVMPNDGDLVDLIPLYAPDAAIRQKLLVDNPARIFGFEA